MGNNTKSRPTWIRDREGNVYSFESCSAAGKFIGRPAQSVQYGATTGCVIVGQWQATQVEDDWSHCKPFSAGRKGTQHIPGAWDAEMKAKVHELYGKKEVEVKAPKMNEPKTEEDFEEMRQRAMQPFVCSLSNEEILRREEDTRKESVKIMKNQSQRCGHWNGVAVASLPQEYYQ